MTVTTQEAQVKQDVVPDFRDISIKTIIGRQSEAAPETLAPPPVVVEQAGHAALAGVGTEIIDPQLAARDALRARVGSDPAFAKWLMAPIGRSEGMAWLAERK